MFAFALYLWLLAAPAQDVVPSVDACPFTPIDTPAPERPPDAVAPSHDFVRCEVTAEVDARGKPVPKQVEACSDPRARGWRCGASSRVSSRTAAGWRAR